MILYLLSHVFFIKLVWLLMFNFVLLKTMKN